MQGEREIVNAGTPVLRERAQEVRRERIGDADVQAVIEEMVETLRGPTAKGIPGTSPRGVGLAAPQVGIPSRVIVLEDVAAEIEKLPREAVQKQRREAFACKVIINPVLEPVGNRTAVFYEGCLSVPGYRGLVERHLEVRCTGLDHKGNDVDFVAKGWMARILQHEVDHLDGTLYVDRMFSRSFRRVDKLHEPGPGPNDEFGATPPEGERSGASGFGGGAAVGTAKPKTGVKFESAGQQAKRVAKGFPKARGGKGGKKRR